MANLASVTCLVFVAQRIACGSTYIRHIVECIAVPAKTAGPSSACRIRLLAREQPRATGCSSAC